ncbi:MAG: hypothetical protein JKY65_27010 [Planctomycetes bacterium]|nr:hypothetical protein [Planctomycetota bacterium]
MTEVEVIDGGGNRLVVVLRSEVWRGRSGVIVATWDPKDGSVAVALDTWDLLARDYGCALQSRSAEATVEAMPSGQRHLIEGVVIDLVVTSD